MSSIKEALAAASKASDLRLSSYRELCAVRDTVNTKVAPVQAALDRAIVATQKAQLEEQRLAAQIDALWGEDWVALKREIANLARSLGKIPPA
jgi:hypothetical protein